MPNPDPQPSPDAAPAPSIDRQATRFHITVVRGSRVESRTDHLAGEEPMLIRAAGPGQMPVDVTVTMHTPGDEADLAAGFLFTEGVIASADDIVGIEVGDPAVLSNPDDEVLVRLARPFDISRLSERHFVATAGCGICGKASLDAVQVRTSPLPPGPQVAGDTLLALPGLLRTAQRTFEATGGIHAAGLFTPDGELVAVREDIGRHNAVDKLIGSQVVAGQLPLHDRILLVSSRAGFEIVQKAAVAGIPVMAAVSAPSDLAVELAERVGLTLVGFLRGDGYNIYTHPHRISI
jgi:FdhD protein